MACSVFLECDSGCSVAINRIQNGAFVLCFMELIVERHWYAMKVFYNKVFEVEDYLKSISVECYIPVVWKEVVRNNQKQMVRKPAISSLLFCYASLLETKVIAEALERRAFFYCSRDNHQPSAIPDYEMQIFKMVTSKGEDGLEYMDVNAINFAQGERVRVTDGPFQGAEGYIKRIKGNRRLVVAIEGVVAVATSYIPSCYLERLED